MRDSNLQRLDIVFDRYFKQSLKSQTREKRGFGTHISVKDCTQIFKNWRNFLRLDKNKEELFSLLATQIEMHDVPGKTVVATLSEGVVYSGVVNQDNLVPCNHEEVDTTMFVHLKSAVESGHSKVSIRTVDTDVVVIALAMFQSLTVEELWVEFGTGKNKRWLPIHDYSTNITDSIRSGLLFWFAFTGCDTVSSFCGRGKKIAWETWKSYPDITNTFTR